MAGKPQSNDGKYLAVTWQSRPVSLRTWGASADSLAKPALPFLPSAHLSQLGRQPPLDRAFGQRCDRSRRISTDRTRDYRTVNNV